MHGTNVGNLVLNVIAGSTTQHLKTLSGDHGNHWNTERVNAHVHTSGTFKVDTRLCIGMFVCCTPSLLFCFESGIFGNRCCLIIFVYA